MQDRGEQKLREETTVLNWPRYPEMADEMFTLNSDRNETAFATRPSV